MSQIYVPPNLRQPVTHAGKVAAVDSLVREARERTPAEAQELRKVPRASIAELNDLDIDAVKARFAKVQGDRRGPVTRFLDLIDLPRNTIAGLIAPSIKRRSESQGLTGAAGQGKVYFSDILEDMGVENRVIRGVVGFAGDVLMDPLTYVGPPGWGAKAVTSGGRTAQFTKQFVKQAKMGAKATDPLIQEYIRAAGLVDSVPEALLGGQRTRGNKVLRVLGEDYETRGSQLAEDVFDVIDASTPADKAARINAAKAVYERYGRHNAPGIRIGKEGVEASLKHGRIRAGTGYAHIPFTDIGVYGPAITPRARQGIAAGQLAKEVGKDTNAGFVEAAQTDIDNFITSEVTPRVERARKLVRDVEYLDDAEAAIARGEASLIGRPVQPSASVSGDIADTAGTDIQNATPLGSERIVTRGRTTPLPESIEDAVSEKLDGIDREFYEYHKRQLEDPNVSESQYAKSKQIVDRIEGEIAAGNATPSGEMIQPPKQEVFEILPDDATGVAGTSSPAQLPGSEAASLPQEPVAQPIPLSVRRQEAVAELESILEDLAGPRKQGGQARQGGINNELAEKMRQLEVSGTPAELLRATKVYKAAQASADMARADFDKLSIRRGLDEPIWKAMREELDKTINDRIKSEASAFNSAEDAKMAAYPEVKFSKADMQDETGVGILGRSGAAMRGDKARYMRDQYANMPLNRERLIVMLAADAIEGKIAEDTYGITVGLDPNRLQIGDRWSLGEWQFEVVDAGDNISVQATKPGKQISPGVIHREPPEVYTVQLDKPLPASRGTLVRSGDAVPLEPPTRDAFDSVGARSRIAEEETARYRQRLTDANDIRIADMSEERIQAMSRLQDILAVQAEAAQSLATASQGSVAAVFNSRDRALMDAAKMALGFGPDELGYRPFATLSAASDSLFNSAENTAIGKGTWADELDKASMGVRRGIANTQDSLQRIFGNKSGTRYEIERAIGRANSPFTSESGRAVAKELSDDLDAVMASNGIAKSSDSVEAIRNLAGLIMDAEQRELIKGDFAETALKTALASGILNRDLYPNLYDDLKAMTTKWKERLRSLGMYDQESGRILNLREDYGLPSRITKQGQEALLAQKANAGAWRPGESSGNQVGRIVERFQKPRSTDVYQYDVEMPDGSIETKRFMDGERVYLTFDENDLRAFTPEQAAEITKRQQIIKAYDALPYSQKSKPLSYSRVHLNKMIRDGELSMLTGGATPEQFFDEDIVQAVTSRFMNSERAELRQYLTDWASTKAFQLDTQGIDKNWQKLPNGAAVKLRNGTTARLENVDGTLNLWVGDKRFRRPKSDKNLSAIYDPTQAVYNTDLYSSFYPDEVASLIENSASAFQNDEAIGKLLKAADTASRIWKGVTLFHPSWTINDILGSLNLAFNAGINPLDIARNLPNALRIVMANNRADAAALEAGTFVDKAGRTFRYADAIQPGVQGVSTAGEVIGHYLSDGTYLGPTGQSLFRNPKGWVNERHQRAMKMSQTAVDANRAKKGLAYAKGLVFDDGVARGIWEPWVKLNATANDWIRTAAFMSLLDSGQDLQSAARTIGDKMLDMTTLTRAEENIRRLVPFYSWTKNSAVFGVRQLLENPKFFSIAPHLKNNLEEAMNGEGNIPRHLRPSWMADQLALQIGTDPDTRKFALLGSMLPSEAATYFIQGAASPLLGQAALQDAVEYFGNTLTPLLKIPGEIASGREWFTKREISGQPDEGDLSVYEHLIGQIRPLRELGVGNVRQGPIQSAFGRSIGEGVARLTIGGRIQPGGDERLTANLTREFKPKEASIRKRIALAEREGNKEASLSARAALLRLYDDMQKRGLEVPRWASTQLETVR